MRNDGFEALLEKVVKDCETYEVGVPDMDDPYYQSKSSTRQTSFVSNLHHYKTDCLISIVDLQLKELNARFDVENTELLHCVGCLSHYLSFVDFDEDKLMKMTTFFPDDFLEWDESSLRNQFANYIEDVRSDHRFKDVKGLADLSRKLRVTKKCKIYAAVYKLVKFALIFPVATASVERVFSEMKHVKSELRNKMGDQWLYDHMMCFIEKDVFMTISMDDLLDTFQKLSVRKNDLV